MDSKSTNSRTIGYYLWALTERFGAGVIAFAGNIALAYLLTPDDFGLIAMLGVFTALAQALIDSGLSDALLNTPNPSRRDFDTLFWFNAAVGTAIALLYAAIAPAVANILERPLLQPILTILGLNALPAALTIAPQTLLRSQLRFKAGAIVSLFASTVSTAVAVTIAYATASYWALVALQVTYAVALSLAAWATTRWWPKPQFDTLRFRQLYRYGINLLLSGIVVQVSQNIFAFVLGQRFSAAQAGCLNQAQKLQQTPVNAFEAAVSSTTFILAGKQPLNTDRTAIARQMFDKYTLVLTLVCCAMMAMCNQIIGCIFPHKWLPVIPYLQLLLIWALIYPVNNYMMVIFKLFNSTHIIRNIITAERVLLVIAAFTLWRFGINTIIVMAAALSAITLTISVFLAARTTQTRARTWFAAYGRNLITAALLAAPSAAVSLLLPIQWSSLLLATLTYLIILSAYLILTKKIQHLCHYLP